MNEEKPSPPVEAGEEITALIETLLATEQRLEELTGGEVDTVAGRDGRTFLLRRAQDELRYREAGKQAAMLNEMRVLFDMVPAMIWFKDTKNGFLRVNKRVAEMTGMRIGEIEGKSAFEIFPHEAAGYYADDLEVIRTGVPKLGIVEKLRGSTGEELWVQTDKVPVCDKHGTVTGLIAMVQDISERKRAETRFRRLVDSNVQSVIFWNTKGQITDANARLSETRGLYPRRSGSGADQLADDDAAGICRTRQTRLEGNGRHRHLRDV